MSAFAAMVDRLFGGPLGVDATWLADGTGSGVAVRVVRTVPSPAGQRGVGGFAVAVAPAAQAARAAIDVRLADVAAPRVGDSVVIDGRRYPVRGVPMLDDEGLIWTCELGPGEAEA